MKRRIAAAVLCAGLLCGCTGGSYVHVERHQASGTGSQSQTLTAENEAQLLAHLQQLVSSCTQSCVIYVDAIAEKERLPLVDMVHNFLLEEDPVGSFALEDVSVEIGTNRGRPALAVNFVYARSNADIRRIIRTQTPEEASKEIETALIACKSRVAVQIMQYTETDFVQLVSDLAQKNVDTVMEFPTTTESFYGMGESRVVELIFAYENSRDALRRMQTQVKPIFDAASLYVSGDGADYQKLSQLYAFLMERFSYTIETSITPAYSLLCHGVGDSRAFALVYAAMCRNAGLNCQTVTGTRYGEPWIWNRVIDNGSVYYVDLIRCSQSGYFREMTESEMTGYVWDYSAEEPEPETA